jgi:hypothetical protein
MSLGGGGVLRQRPARADDGDESEALRLVPPAPRILAGAARRVAWPDLVRSHDGEEGGKVAGPEAVEPSRSSPSD